MYFLVWLFSKVIASPSPVGDVNFIHWSTRKSRTGSLALRPENFWDNPAEIHDSHTHLKLAYVKKHKWSSFSNRCWFMVPLSCEESPQNAAFHVPKHRARSCAQFFCCQLHQHLGSGISEPRMISEKYSEEFKGSSVRISKDFLISVQLMNGENIPAHLAKSAIV